MPDCYARARGTLTAHMRTPWGGPNLEVVLIQLPFMVDGRPYGDTYVAEPLVMRKVDDDLGGAVEPTFRLRSDEAQQFMDELWRIGVRPTEGSGSAGMMAAVQKHFEDMRTIAFTKLGIAGEAKK